MKLTSADLKAVFDGFGYGPGAVLTIHHAVALAGFAAIAEELEPELSFAEPDGRRKWISNLRSLQSAMRTWERGADALFAVSGLETLVQLATASWRGPVGGVIKPLPFVASAHLRVIAERDYATLLATIKQEHWKPSVILAGCVIEAVLADALDVQDAATRTGAARSVATAKRWPNSFEPAIPDRWRFHQMIEVCGPAPGLALLSERTVSAAHAVRDARNFVHPRLEAATMTTEPLRGADAQLALALVESILADFE